MHVLANSINMLANNSQDLSKGAWEMKDQSTFVISEINLLKSAFFIIQNPSFIGS